MATERFEHAVGGEGSDHASVSESGELAGPTDPDEHAGAGATMVGGCGAGDDVGGQRRHRQARLHLHGVGPYALATVQPNLHKAADAVPTDPARAMGQKTGAAPTLAAAFGIGNAVEQAQVMRTCSPHVNTRTRQKTGSWTNETLQ